MLNKGCIGLWNSLDFRSVVRKADSLISLPMFNSRVYLVSLVVILMEHLFNFKFDIYVIMICHLSHP